MMVNYSNEIDLEQIDSYLHGLLTDIERQEVEEKMESDPNFRQLVEQQKIINEGVRVVCFVESRNHLKRIHKEIELEKGSKEPLKLIQKPSKGPFYLNPVLLVAASLIIGLLIGSFWINSSLNDASNNMSDATENQTEELFGEGSDELPLFDRPVKMISILVNDENYKKSEKTVLLQVNEARANTIDYTINQGALNVFLPQHIDVDQLLSNSISIVTLNLDEPNMQIVALKNDSITLEIPIDNEDFDFFFNK